MSERMKKGSLVLAVQLLAFWPVWRWYALRLADGADEPWGILALGTALFFLWRKKPAHLQGRTTLTAPTLLILLYAAAFPFLRPLPRAAIAVTAVGWTLSSLRSGSRLHPGVAGLLLLSLQVIPSMQFYLGYPLRALVTELAVPLLRVAGFGVFRDGTYLNWSGQIIQVDAPCSGIRMLWAGMYLTFALSLFYELSPWKTCLAAAAAGPLLILGNVLRAAALFFLEAGVIELPAWTHEGAGVAAFLLAASLIAGCILNIRRKTPCAFPSFT